MDMVAGRAGADALRNRQARFAVSMVSAPNNSRDATLEYSRRRSRNPEDHSPRHADRCSGAPCGRRNAGARPLRFADHARRSAENAHGAGAVAGRQPSNHVELDLDARAARLGEAELARKGPAGGAHRDHAARQGDGRAGRKGCGSPPGGNAGWTRRSVAAAIAGGTWCIASGVRRGAGHSASASRTARPQSNNRVSPSV